MSIQPVVVSGCARHRQSEKAFATRLRQIEHGACHYRCPDRTPRVPQPIADVVQAVLGFDERPRISRLRSMAETQGSNGLYPSDMARLYSIATARHGAGQCIALIEPAGGYDPEDLKRACEAMKDLGLLRPIIFGDNAIFGIG